MVIGLTVVTALLAVICVLSAVMKLTGQDHVVASVHGTVGVPLRHFPVLAALELAGAAGIVIGLWFEPLGIAAAIGLVGYFTGAVIGHLRVGDAKGLGPPLQPLALAIAVLVLHVLIP